MRIKITSFLLSIILCQSALAQQIPLPLSLPKGLPNDINLNKIEITKPSAPDADNLQFNDISLNNLLSVLFQESLSKNFVLSPKVLEDTRAITFRYSKKKDGALISFLSTFLKSLGYDLVDKNGVLYVQEQQQKKPEDFNYYVYSPKFRDGSYLINQLRSFFSENFKSEVKSIKSDIKAPSDNYSPTSAYANLDNSSEVLTFRYDNEKEKNKILDFISRLDTEEDSLLIKAYIYEVTYSNEDGSAMGLMLNLANSKLKINLGSQNPVQNFVQFSSNAMGLLVSNINTDSRFKLISNPFIRVRNNKQGSFNVGASVPVLGSVSYQNNGTPVQEVKYVDSGLTFQITPHIKTDSINLEFLSDISEVQNTTTGVNNTPTLTKRKLNLNLNAHKDEVILLAGLTNNKNVQAKSTPFIFPFFKNNNSSQSNTEIIIFLEVKDSEPKT